MVDYKLKISEFVPASRISPDAIDSQDFGHIPGLLRGYSIEITTENGKTRWDCGHYTYGEPEDETKNGYNAPYHIAARMRMGYKPTGRICFRGYCSADEDFEVMSNITFNEMDVFNLDIEAEDIEDLPKNAEYNYEHAERCFKNVFSDNPIDGFDKYRLKISEFIPINIVNPEIANAQDFGRVPGLLRGYNIEVKTKNGDTKWLTARFTDDEPEDKSVIGNGLNRESLVRNRAVFGLKPTGRIAFRGYYKTTAINKESDHADEFGWEENTDEIEALRVDITEDDVKRLKANADNTGNNIDNDYEDHAFQNNYEPVYNSRYAEFYAHDGHRPTYGEIYTQLYGNPGYYD